MESALSYSLSRPNSNLLLGISYCFVGCLTSAIFSKQQPGHPSSLITRHIKFTEADQTIKQKTLKAEDGSVSLPPNIINWHIPRPSLWYADSNRPSSISREQPKWPGHQNERGSTSSQASSSSNTSTQSGASGSLLLTAANLAALRYESTIKSPETQSVASSTHFTVVNGITRRKTQPLSTCCCQSHQLTTLVFTMSSIFLVAIIMAVIYLEMRWRDTNLFR